MEISEAHLPRIVGTGTAAPPYVVGVAETKSSLHRIFGAAYPDLSQAERMVDHTAIEQRHLAQPIDDLVAERSLEQKNGVYCEYARDLGRRAAEAALSASGVDRTAIDLVIAVSCTGYMIPSLDVYLTTDLGLRPGVRRLPITELGCGGGAAAIALAADFIRGCPGSTALVVSVELCSLTFQPGDMSWPNVVAAMLFGDAAAAAVITDHDLCPGPAVVASRTHLFPDTLDYMGFILKDSGLHLVMSPEVPEMVRRAYRPLLDDFLATQSLRAEDIGFYVLHPGGAKILRYLHRYVGVPDAWLAPSAEVLRLYGNTSSTSVLLVLDQVVRNRQPSPGALGLMGSLGPGFCAEMLLVRWDG